MKKQDKVALTSSERAVNYEVAKFIMQVVADYYDKPVSMITEKSGKQIYVSLRKCVVYFLYKHTSFGPTEMGRILGKTHADVMHMKETIDGYLMWDVRLRKEIQEMQKIILLKKRSVIKGMNFNDYYYYIDANNFKSLRMNESKAIMFVGFTDEEINTIKNLVGLQGEKREHTDTKMFVLEKRNEI